MNPARCAGCKYLRRRCPSDCVLSPYFPGNDPRRFECVHKIYGASNVTKLIQRVPVERRAETAESLYREAQCRIRDPVYGIVGMVTQLRQQIYNAQCELAKIQAEIAILNGQNLNDAAPLTMMVNPHFAELQGDIINNLSFFPIDD